MSHQAKFYMGTLDAGNLCDRIEGFVVKPLLYRASFCMCSFIGCFDVAPVGFDAEYLYCWLVKGEER